MKPLKPLDIRNGDRYLLDCTQLGMPDKCIEVTVRGVATTGVPVAGRSVIVHAPELNSDVYPFDYCCVFEAWLRPLP